MRRPGSAAPAPILAPLFGVLALWRGRIGWLAAGVLVSLASLGAAVALLTLSGLRIAAAIAGLGLGAGLALRLAGVARVGLRYAERLVTHSATFRALADLRVWFFRGLSASAAGGLGLRRSGDVLSRLVGDVEALDGLYLRVLVPLVGALLLLPVLVILLGLQSWRLGLGIGLLFATAALLLPMVGARYSVAAGATVSEAGAGLRVAALDTLAGLREVRAFGAEGRMLAAVQAAEASLLSAQRGLSRRAAGAQAAAFLCGEAAVILVLLLHPPRATVAVAALFLVVASFEVVIGLPRAGVLAGHAAAAARRVLQVGERPMADAAAAAATGRLVAMPSGHALALEAVRYAWQPDRAAVFDGLSLTMPAGSHVAILGPSGSGKSTVAALLLRVAEPQAGRVTLGGVDIARLPPEALRSRIAWLGQSTHLFDDTVRANLLLGRPDADDATLWAALDQAEIGVVVRTLPGGLDAWVGERGAGLSGGQSRRLALARALVSRAPILILDEPCEGLDAETEQAFLTTLNGIGEGRTVLLIAHRLTGVEQLDRIWRLSAAHAVAAAA